MKAQCASTKDLNLHIYRLQEKTFFRKKVLKKGLLIITKTSCKFNDKLGAIYVRNAQKVGLRKAALPT